MIQHDFTKHAKLRTLTGILLLVIVCGLALVASGSSEAAPEQPQAPDARAIEPPTSPLPATDAAGAADGGDAGPTAEDPATGIALQWPASGTVTAPYGFRVHPKTEEKQFHDGLDIANATGTPVVAAADGTVILAEYSGGWGNVVLIRHDDDWVTRYAHLDAIETKEGDKVEAGQQIGRMGFTGNATGSILHFSVYYRDQPADPAMYLPEPEAPPESGGPTQSAEAAAF